MPIYDFTCPHCGALNELPVSKEVADKLQEQETPQKCKSCGGIYTWKNRKISDTVKKRVLGVSKGNYGSGDWS